MTNTTINAVAEAIWRLDYPSKYHMSFKTFCESLSNKGEWAGYYDREMRARHKKEMNKYKKKAQAAIQAYEKEKAIPSYSITIGGETFVPAPNVKEMTVDELKNMVYNAIFSVNAHDITKALAKLGTIRITGGEHVQ